MKLIRSDFFDTLSNSVLNKAIAIANNLRCGEINCSHMLSAIISLSSEMAQKFEETLHITKEEFNSALADQCNNGEFGKETEFELSIDNISTPLKNVFNNLSIEYRETKEKVTVNDLYTAIINIDGSEVFSTLDYMGIDPDEVVMDAMNSDNFMKKLPMTSRYAVDMCEMARRNMYDPIDGRDDVIDNVIEVLGRRQKGNPCLIGEPGVGKTAIIEGLAQRIIDGNVPKYIKGKHILSVDVSGIVSGSRFRGEFEDRLNRILYEVDAAGDCILFFDEFHMLMEAGGSSTDSTMTAANILKPAISRGDIKIIGATTTKEYMKYVENDAAFNRRIQSILVDEPDNETAIKMVSKVIKVYEDFHNCKVLPKAIEQAVYLSDRYITDKKLPDKAINVIDETAARLKKIAPDDVVFEIDVDDIRETISKISKIDVSEINENSKTRLQTLDKNIRKVVIGQSDAITSAVKAIRRAKAGIKDPNRPVASFLFVGPTGVGKTELTKAITTELTGSIKNLIKFNMSEYMEKHAVSKLIGSPPGYVGFGDGGQLTEAVRHNPNSVVLFDEIEKAHPDIFNIMLQILDEGELQDSKGVKVDFKNSIVIMTSNAGYGAEEATKHIGFGDNNIFESADEIEAKAKKALESTFRPEFLNRLDKIVVFRSLDRDDCSAIAKLEINKLNKRLQYKNINITYDNDVIDHIVDVGYSDKYGARNIKRKIQEEIEDIIADEIIDEKILPDSSVRLTYKDKIIINNLVEDTVDLVKTIDKTDSK